MKTIDRGLTLEQRFMARVERTDGCWFWRGNIDPATGRGRYGGRWAPRVAYELFLGPLDPLDHVHHVCETPLCVNPLHLEALTADQHRDAHRSEACIRGHAFIEHGRRTRRGAWTCRRCDRDRKRRSRE